MAGAVESLTTTLQNLTVKELSIGAEHWIKVTHINDPDNFYVRLLHYDTHMNDIQARSDHMTREDATYKAIVIFKAKTINKYVRGRIEAINEKSELFSIFAVDYGFYETCIPLKHMYKPKKQFFPDSLVLRCKLAFCLPLYGSWDEKAIDAMKCFVGDAESTKMIIEGVMWDQYVVQLINSPPDIGTLMALTGYAALGSATNEVNRLEMLKAKKKYINYKQYNVGDKINVRYINGISMKKFFVADVQDYRDYKEMRVNFEYASKRSGVVSKTDLCVGLMVSLYLMNEDRYERGVVSQIIQPETTARVECVDTGDIVEANRMSMKEIPDKSFSWRHPAAIYCEAEDTQALDYRFRKCLLTGAQYEVTILKVGCKFSTPHLVRIEFK